MEPVLCLNRKKKSLSKTLSGNNLGRNLRKKRRWGRGRKGKGGRKEKKRACTRKKFVFHSRCALEFCQGHLLSPLPLPFTAAAHFWLRSMALCKNCCAWPSSAACKEQMRAQTAPPQASQTDKIDNRGKSCRDLRSRQKTTYTLCPS